MTASRHSICRRHCRKVAGCRQIACTAGLDPQRPDAKRPDAIDRYRAAQWGACAAQGTKKTVCSFTPSRTGISTSQRVKSDSESGRGGSFWGVAGEIGQGLVAGHPWGGRQRHQAPPQTNGNIGARVTSFSSLAGLTPQHYAPPTPPADEPEPRLAHRCSSE